MTATGKPAPHSHKALTMQKFIESSVRRSMAAQPAEYVRDTMNQIREAIDVRRSYELEKRDGELSPDFDNVRNLHTEEMARFSLAIGLNPFPYINSAMFSKREFEELSGLSWEARTQNQRAYKKMSGAASFFYHNDIRGLEETLKSFVACAILASVEHDILPRDLCKNFMGRMNLRRISSELSEVLEKHRARTVQSDNGAQVSHCTLQLAQMKAGEVIRNGKCKDFRLDLQSPVTVSFAERFGLVEELNAARDFRASLYQ